MLKKITLDKIQKRLFSIIRAYKGTSAVLCKTTFSCHWPENLLKCIGNAMSVVSLTWECVCVFGDREERHFNQSLRAEQDEAYMESLRADQEKVGAPLPLPGSTHSQLVPTGGLDLCCYNTMCLRHSQLLVRSKTVKTGLFSNNTDFKTIETQEICLVFSKYTALKLWLLQNYSINGTTYVSPVYPACCFRQWARETGWFWGVFHPSEVLNGVTMLLCYQFC